MITMISFMYALLILKHECTVEFSSPSWCHSVPAVVVNVESPRGHDRPTGLFLMLIVDLS